MLTAGKDASTPPDSVGEFLSGLDEIGTTIDESEHEHSPWENPSPQMSVLPTRWLRALYNTVSTVIPSIAPSSVMVAVVVGRSWMAAGSR